LFDFYCLLCKQGVAGSSPATSTKHIHFNEIASKFSRQTPCSGNRCSPAEAHPSMRCRPLYFQGSAALRSNLRSSIVNPLGPTRQSGAYQETDSQSPTLQVARRPSTKERASSLLVVNVSGEQKRLNFFFPLVPCPFRRSGLPHRVLPIQLCASFNKQAN